MIGQKYECKTHNQLHAANPGSSPGQVIETHTANFSRIKENCKFFGLGSNPSAIQGLYGVMVAKT